jgi:hypothetical protein
LSDLRVFGPNDVTILGGGFVDANGFHSDGIDGIGVIDNPGIYSVNPAVEGVALFVRYYVAGSIIDAGLSDIRSIVSLSSNTYGVYDNNRGQVWTENLFAFNEAGSSSLYCQQLFKAHNTPSWSNGVDYTGVATLFFGNAQGVDGKKASIIDGVAGVDIGTTPQTTGYNLRRITLCARRSNAQTFTALSPPEIGVLQVGIATGLDFTEATAIDQAFRNV